jgi:microsomal dipeptidase-like Zn-dependent dipeptidase
LIEIIEAGGFPVLPPIPPPPPLPPVPTLSELSLVVKAVVDPIIIALRSSQQYQLAKKIFLDRNPEFATYDNIKRSATDPGGHRNVLGISSQGTFAVTEMMRQGMMIDVDHASEKSVNDMIGIAVANHNYPLNSGHNALRGPGDNEKTRTREQLNALRDLGGMMGMGWENQNPVQFNNIYRMHLGIMGNRSMSFGSDIDGYAATPKAPASPSQFINYTNSSQPDFLQPYRMPGSPRVWNYNTEGMAHIGLVPDFFEALKKAGAPTAQLNALFLSAEYFAQMWEKCERTAPLIR